MRIMTQPINMEKVHTIIYHLPDGKSFSVRVDDFEQFVEFGLGEICDTSDIDGVVHFFPHGNA